MSPCSHSGHSNHPSIKMKILIIVTGVIAFAFGEHVLFKDCGSVSGTLESVDITPCPTQPCQFKHKTNVTLTAKFRPKVDTKKAKTVLHGIIDGIPTPFPLPSDACSNNNVACPIQNGTGVTYQNQMYILPEYPKVSLVMKLELQDENGKDLFCFVTPVQITD